MHDALYLFMILSEFAYKKLLLVLVEIQPTEVKTWQPKPFTDGRGDVCG